MLLLKVLIINSFIIVFSSIVILAETTSEITQYGITWIFDGEYQTGKFANGDYWVVGPVIITNIAPDFDGKTNGWEVNPVPSGFQGFDFQCGEFDVSLVPSLPYTALAGQSIVKSISSGDKLPCLKTTAVLTILSSAPPEDGIAVFRPPYVGNDKPFYFINDLQTELLSSYDPVLYKPSLKWVRDRFAPVQLDHEDGAMGRRIHPLDSMPNYGSDIGRDTGDGALRLMLNEPVSEKMPALIAYVQYGIDIYHMILNGQRWKGGGGHVPGKKLPLTFAAVLLNHQSMKEIVENSNFFSEDGGSYYIKNKNKFHWAGRAG